MNWENWWKTNKTKLALVPAIIFWLVSVAFFVLGLQFKNPAVIAGVDITMFIALGLSLSNTIIQIIGNDQAESLEGIMLIIWISSYVLGIATNVYGLVQVLAISNPYIEWAVALSFGSMIEVAPEKLLVLFLHGLRQRPVPHKQPSSFFPAAHYPDGNYNTQRDRKHDKGNQHSPAGHRKPSTPHHTSWDDSYEKAAEEIGQMLRKGRLE